VSQKRLDPVLHAAMAEVSQKRIAGAQRQECQGWGLTVEGLRIQAVHDLVRSAVAADRHELSDTSFISLASHLRRLPGSARVRYLHLDAASPQAFQRRA
jgi:hypothetical protein